MSSNPVTQAPTAPVSSGGPVSDTPTPDALGTPMPNPAAAFAPPVSDTVVAPGSMPAPEVPAAPASDIQSEVVKKIAEAQNVLVALSSDPSVDEMSAAIGLSLFLDKLGKRATAIYSGSTPNALEFLKPEETFETTADTLQDFVIALNKDKADHLRYKLDGDYVKIYITPYKTRIGEEDLIGLFTGFLEQALSNFHYAGILLFSGCHLIKNVPVVRFSVRTHSGLIVTDDHITRLIEFLIEVTLGIKDDHHIILGKGTVQLGHHLEKHIGLTGTNAAQQHKMPAQ